MPVPVISAQTLLEALDHALREAAAFNPNTHAAPVVVLWTDEKREWETLLPRLRAVMPLLLTLGDYDAATKTGPAIWLKCMIGRTLPEADWPEDHVPVLYLPGVSRQQLRAVESCPPELQLLAELQYRGTFWTQVNARDWTVLAFLSSAEGGLGLDVARDQATSEAMQRALAELADEPITHLQGKRLEAGDFDALLLPDSARDLLLWLDAPEAVRKDWVGSKWSAFRTVCHDQYGVDPERDGALAGAERLGRRQGAWKAVWDRFAEAPARYPHLPERLRQARPSAANPLFEDSLDEPWPQDNEALERELRDALKGLHNTLPDTAAQKIADLERQHGRRRAWVWATLDKAPLAGALRHLFELARATRSPLGGATPEAIAQTYRETGWQADEAALMALRSIRAHNNAEAVKTAVEALYRPWLEQAALAFQLAVQQRPLSTALDGLLPVPAAAGRVILFADALRYDVGQLLRRRLDDAGCEVQQGWRFVALPSVTATAKPAVSPAADGIDPRSESDTFDPQTADAAKTLTTDRFRKLVEQKGWQVLLGEETGDPAGMAWTEIGDLDRQGHKEQWKLAWRLDEVLREMSGRIERLLDAGWREVHVVTDHGWLLLPSDLPDCKLPHYLAETRWGRCATLKETSRTDSPTVPWYWNPDVRIAMAPGIGVYRKGIQYAHGGLSPQECVVPTFTVKRAGGERRISITDVAWRGLRCKVTTDGEAGGLRADLRTKAADASTSLSTGQKEFDAEGTVALLVEDERMEGQAVLVVVLDPAGHVVAKMPTVVGV